VEHSNTSPGKPEETNTLRLVNSIFKKFCKLTKRNGGVLVHSSITEWHEFLSKELDAHKAEKE
jgi:hypothetical protein